MRIKSYRETVESYSEEIGRDPLLVQGAGGNASWKEDGVLWVKASGKWLQDALVQDIFVPVDLVDMQLRLREGDLSFSPKVIGSSTLRPSIETLLHGLMPQEVVLHVHAIEVLSVMVRANYDLILKECLDNLGYCWTVVSYQKPGAALASEVASAIKLCPSAEIILLANHGLVIGGASVDEVDQKLRSLCAALTTPPLDHVYIQAPSMRNALVNEYVQIADQSINQLAIDPRLFDRLKQDWALYPDHVVFLGASPFLIEADSENFERYAKKIDFPSIVFYKGVGVFSFGVLSAAKQAQLRCYYDVLARQAPGQQLVVLSDRLVADLLNWDAEAYRQSIAK